MTKEVSNRTETLSYVQFLDNLGELTTATSNTDLENEEHPLRESGPRQKVQLRSSWNEERTRSYRIRKYTVTF